MRTIAIINQKGGCGKTTTSINLAACLARLGQKTLLLDMDPQGHCAIGLAVPEEQIEKTVYDALIEPRDGKPVNIADLVWQIASDFDLAPSNIKLAAFEQVFSGRPGRENRLRLALDKVSANYRWCIVDCPPSVGLITFNALRACDVAIVPVETGYFSLHGLSKMMQTLEMMREQCGNEIAVRVLPTLYDTRTKLAREVLAELRNDFKDYLMQSTVNFNTKLKEAASFGQPITEYDPGSRGYKDFVNLARELMGENLAEAEPTPMDQLSRPAELVRRAKQLSQLTNVQFGRNTLTAHAVVPVVGPAEVLQSRESDMSSLEEEIADGAIVRAPVLNTMWAQPKPTTEEKIEEIYGVQQVGEEVQFLAKFDSAKRVLIAGDFNGWSPASTPMSRHGENNFITKLPLQAGRYRYRFVVDGRWTTDPNNSNVETNQFGELNNIIEVK